MSPATTAQKDITPYVEGHGPMSFCAEAAGATVGKAPQGGWNGCAIRFAAAGSYKLTLQCHVLTV